MKKYYLPFVVAVVVISICSCKRDREDVLEYSNISTYDWVQASVQKRTRKEPVLWLQLFDQVNNATVLRAYKNASSTLNKYPADIFEDKWVQVLINNRFEIRVFAEAKATDYKNTEKLKHFIEKFDIGGLEKYTGAKLSGAELRKYIPKLK